MNNDPVAPCPAPAAPPRIEPPKVLLWFKIYCAFLCFLYLATAAASVVFFLMPDSPDMPRGLAVVVGIALLFGGLAFFGACLLPLLLAPRPWLWVYDLVIICVGMTSACILPACIPLLLFWLKPETQRYFGRKAG